MFADGEQVGEVGAQLGGEGWFFGGLGGGFGDFGAGVVGGVVAVDAGLAEDLAGVVAEGGPGVGERAVGFLLVAGQAVPPVLLGFSSV
nr:hypothetical protein [Nocardia crassostreae]